MIIKNKMKFAFLIIFFDVKDHDWL